MLTHTAKRRIMHDLKDLHKSKQHYFEFDVNNENLQKLNVWILGPKDTPYEGGFFQFEFKFPQNYPWKPPHVVIKTTEHGAVRFNPNLYANGKVCLSILGTWQGPQWTPIQNIRTVILSITSLFNENPLHNEPGWEGCTDEEKIQNYNNFIKHEVVRVAICKMMQERKRFPSHVQKWMCQHFKSNYPTLMQKCQQNQNKDGTKIMDSLYHSKTGKFTYAALGAKLTEINAQI